MNNAKHIDAALYDALRAARVRRNAHTIKGFDYRHGARMEFSATEWTAIREAVIAAGGSVKWCRGEMWLFGPGHVWLYEIYYRDRDDDTSEQGNLWEGGDL